MLRRRSERVPLESTKPIGSFAQLRLLMALISLAALAVFPLQHRYGLLVLFVGGALPWAAAVFLIARYTPKAALHPAVAAGDLLILALGQLTAPELYPVVRFLAIFLFAAHAHYQGARRGTAFAVGGCILLTGTTLLSDRLLINGTFGFSETLFWVTGIFAGVFIGRLRAAESTGRLRARDLTRRTIAAEANVRRRVAIALHDGPVQLSVSLDMTLEAARRALARGESERAAHALVEARGLSGEVVETLREELIGLGPYALEELSVNEALERCAPAWRRRFEVAVELSLDRLELSNEICGALFGIAQEAVVNAGRHAGASTIRISLRAVQGGVELRIADDGHGFRATVPFGPYEPGHIGLASMRERAELQDGALAIESSTTGSTVTVRLPLGPSAEPGAASDSSAAAP